MPLLSAYRILELADESGAWCGRVLADLGADVVKIEPPGGERSRFYPPFAARAPAPEASLYFAGRNLNKRSLVLDLDSADDRETFHRLVAAADALIAGGPPGTVDSKALHVINPRLAVILITPYGADGPYRDRPGTALTAFALGGPLWRSGFAHRPPVAPPADLAYAIAGITAATAAFIGLLLSRRTGRGCTIDASIVEAVSATNDWSVPAYSTTRFMFNRAGPGLAYPIYPCRDGYVRVVAFTANQWRALRRWLGEPEALQGPEWDSLLYRITNAPAIDVFTAELCAGKTMRELYDEGLRRGCPVAPVYTVADALDDAQMVGRGAFVRVHHPAIGPMTLPASPVRLASEPPSAPRPAPLLNQHAREVGRDWQDTVAPRPPAASATVTAATLLAGTRVIDFGQGGVGTEAARILATLGAEVIRPESRAHPEFLRAIGGPEALDASANFVSSNRGKQSIALNVRDERGRALFLDLVRCADVLIDNNGGAVMDRLGLGWETLSAVNPHLIMASSSLNGATGPRRAALGFGPSAQSVGGLARLWGYPDDGSPAASQHIFPDHVTGRLLALCVLAALERRAATGRGERLDIAQAEVVAMCLPEAYLEYTVNGTLPRRRGNRCPQHAPQGVYPCRPHAEPPQPGALTERWIAISVQDDAAWARFAALPGLPDWLRDPTLATLPARQARHDELDAAITAWTAEREAEVLRDLLGEAGIAAAIVATPIDQLADPHLQARGAFRPLDQPVLGRVLVEREAWRICSEADTPERPAPLLGEHTEAIAGGLLGLSPETIAALQRDRLLY